MSAIFFEQMRLKRPDHHLAIGSGTHGHQTGEGLKQIEAILMEEAPDAVLVYGDTNATLAGALAAAKLHIPIAHVEAGLRSFNRRMPEEVNRVLTDHLSQWLFAPTTVAVENLAHEGMTQGVFQVGDVMLDAVRLFLPYLETLAPNPLERFAVSRGDYYLLTTHRAETTDQPDQLMALLRSLDQQAHPVVFPMHPRVRSLVEGYTQSQGAFQHIRCVEPVGYLEMLCLESNARAIVTDSGGVQKESAFVQVPCLTLREETEWVETVETGWNRLVGLSVERLTAGLREIEQLQRPAPIDHLYGNGSARTAIVQQLLAGDRQPQPLSR
jgi:UDP-N-acetylglucosamine 2-epimerase